MLTAANIIEKALRPHITNNFTYSVRPSKFLDFPAACSLLKTTQLDSPWSPSLELWKDRSNSIHHLHSRLQADKQDLLQNPGIMQYTYDLLLTLHSAKLIAESI